MRREDMIAAIENAKDVHLEQMQKIKSEMAGKKVDNPTALGKMECDCGLWFHANEKIMKDILGLQLFERLDKNHEQWHVDYENIYNLFFKEEKKGFFSKIIGTSKANMMKIDKGKLYFSELKKDTQELLNTSEIALRRISALSGSKFS